MKVILLGAGKLGKQLYRTSVDQKETPLVQWYDRSASSAISPEGIPIVKELNQLKTADLYLLAVSDNAIGSIAQQLPKNALVVHTAGSVSIDVLLPHPRRGVCYPVQSFSTSQQVSFSKLSFAVEASNADDTALLMQWVERMGAVALSLNSHQREVLHLAAVLVNNFTNHLYVQAAALCKAHQLSFDLLRPLIAETAQKIEALSPEAAQTGPALRNDTMTLQRHLEIIQDPTLKTIYNTLTTSIQKHHESSQL